MNSKHCLLCVRCMVDLTDLQCALDLDAKQYLCLSCFAQGKAPAGANTLVALRGLPSRYKILQNLSIPLFSPDWTLKEELLLLDALSKTGFGNWTGVAKIVGSKKKSECEERYMKVACC